MNPVRRSVSSAETDDGDTDPMALAHQISELEEEKHSVLEDAIPFLADFNKAREDTLDAYEASWSVGGTPLTHEGILSLYDRCMAAGVARHPWMVQLRELDRRIRELQRALRVAEKKKSLVKKGRRVPKLLRG